MHLRHTQVSPSMAHICVYKEDLSLMGQGTHGKERKL